MRWEQVIIIDKKRKSHLGDAAMEFARHVLKDEFSTRLPTLDGFFHVHLDDGAMIINAPGVRDALMEILEGHVRDIKVEPVKTIAVHRIIFQPKHSRPNPIGRAVVNKVVLKPKSPYWFGTDLNKKPGKKGSWAKQEVVKIFSDAFKSGFTCFDAAYKYKLEDGSQTIKLLDEAASANKVDRNKITVLYKVTHEHPLQGQVGLFDAKWGKKILVLHDINAEETARSKDQDLFTFLESWVKEVCQAALKNKMYFGVSNVSMGYLESIQSWAKDAGSGITYIENRYTPYTETQGEIIKYCHDNDITYLAYGIAGSVFEGSCDAKGGLPSDLLAARVDRKLIDAVDKSENVMYTLFQWCVERDINPIVCTSNMERMKTYLKGCGIPEKFSKAMATYVVTNKFSEVDDEWATSLRTLPPEFIKVLVETDCPLAWRLMEKLEKAGVSEYLNRLINDVVLVYNKMASTFANNLLRLAFDYQQLHMRDKPERWEESVVETFKIREKSKKKETYECVIEWACRPYTEKDGGGSVEQIEKSILDGTYKPAHPITETGKKNTGLTRLRSVEMDLSKGPITSEDNKKLQEEVYDEFVDYIRVVAMDWNEGDTLVTFKYYHDVAPEMYKKVADAIIKVREDAKQNKEPRDEWTKR